METKIKLSTRKELNSVVSKDGKVYVHILNSILQGTWDLIEGKKSETSNNRLLLFNVYSSKNPLSNKKELKTYFCVCVNENNKFIKFHLDFISMYEYNEETKKLKLLFVKDFNKLPGKFKYRMITKIQSKIDDYSVGPVKCFWTYKTL